MKSLFKISITGLCLSTALSFADTGSLGLMAGYSLPVGGDENLSSRMAFGVEGSYNYSPDLSLGTYLAYSNATKNSDYKSRFIPVGFEVNFLLSETLEGLYAGANAGFVMTNFTSVTYPAWDGSSFDFSFGGQVGYDYRFLDNFSAGAKVQTYLVYFLNEYLDHTMFVNAFVTAKYWF